MNCPYCVGGWIAHDLQCRECDGTGKLISDPFLDGADFLYDEEQDREAEERE